MAINWPSNPTQGQTYQSPNGDVWSYNGYAWIAKGNLGTTGPTGNSGVTLISGTISLSGSSYTGNLGSSTSYSDGDTYYVQPTSNSVEGATININGIGSVNLYKDGGVRINVDDFMSNIFYEIVYTINLEGSSINGFLVKGLPRVIRAVYDFSVMGGSSGTYNLTSNFPTSSNGILLSVKDSIVYPIITPVGSTGGMFLNFGISIGSQWYVIETNRPVTSPVFSGYPFKPQNSSYSSFTINATGAGINSINSVSLNNSNMLNGVVNFDTSISQTVQDVIDNINSNPGTTFRAESSGSTAYLYPTIHEKYRWGFYFGTPESLSVGATGFSVTDVNYSSFNPTDYLVVSTSSPLSMTITGSGNLTAGKIMIIIPYFLYR